MLDPTETEEREILGDRRSDDAPTQLCCVGVCISTH